MQDLIPVEKHEIVEDVPFEAVITDKFIESLERAANLYQSRYLPLCFKLTNSGDWVNHGSEADPKFSLQASGAEKLCNPFNINWDAPVVTKHERQDEQGKFYEYEVQGIVKCHSLKRYGWFTGNCSSRDQFFVGRGKFDEGDIRKAAFSNWLVNGVTRLLGIRNPNPTILQVAGIEPGKIQKIEYNKKQSDAPISEPQGNRLRTILSKAKGTEEQLRDHLQSLKYDLKDVPPDKAYYIVRKRDYEAVCKWAENPTLPAQPAATKSESSLKPGEPCQGVLIGMQRIENDPAGAIGKTAIKAGERTITIFFSTIPDTIKGKAPADLMNKPCSFTFEIKGEGNRKRWWLTSLEIGGKSLLPEVLEYIVAQGFVRVDIEPYCKAQHAIALEAITTEIFEKLKKEIADGTVTQWLTDNSSFANDGKE